MSVFGWVEVLPRTDSPCREFKSSPKTPRTPPACRREGFSASTRISWRYALITSFSVPDSILESPSVSSSVLSFDDLSVHGRRADPTNSASSTSETVEASATCEQSLTCEQPTVLTRVVAIELANNVCDPVGVSVVEVD